MTTKVERCAIYIRVSTTEQMMHGKSLEAQKEYLTNYARLHHKKYQIHTSYACDSASITCIEDLAGLLHSCMQQLEQNPSTLL